MIWLKVIAMQSGVSKMGMFCLVMDFHHGGSSTKSGGRQTDRPTQGRTDQIVARWLELKPKSLSWAVSVWLRDKVIIQAWLGTGSN